LFLSVPLPTKLFRQMEMGVTFQQSLVQLNSPGVVWGSLPAEDQGYYEPAGVAPRVDCATGERMVSVWSPYEGGVEVHQSRGGDEHRLPNVGHGRVDTLIKVKAEAERYIDEILERVRRGESG